MGLGVLFIGFVAGVEILEIVGATLAGLVVLGVIVDNFLVAVHFALGRTLRYGASDWTAL